MLPKEAFASDSMPVLVILRLVYINITVSLLSFILKGFLRHREKEEDLCRYGVTGKSNVIYPHKDLLYYVPEFQEIEVLLLRYILKVPSLTIFPPTVKHPPD